MAQIIIRNPAALRGTSSPTISRQALGITAALTRRRFAVYVKALSAQKLRLLNDIISTAAGFFSVTPLTKAKNLFSFVSALFSLICTFASDAATTVGRTFMRTYYGVMLKLRDTRVKRVNGAIMMGMVVSIMLAATFIGMGLEVKVDGVSIGYVSSQKDFENAVVSAQNRVSDILGVPYKIDMDVSYRFDFVDRSKILDLNQVKEQLFARVDEVKRLYVLRVDGEIVGANASDRAIRELLDSMMAKYPIKSPNDRVEFMRKVEVTNELTAAENALSIDGIKEVLASNQRETVTYLVEKGDTISKIAARSGISENELISLNPSIANGKLIAGEEIVVKKAIPFLSVKYYSRQVYTEDIPYETKIINDDAMFKGEKKTVTRGVAGKASVTADIVYVDGEQTDKSIVSREIVKEPVTEVIRVGTKQRIATGKFMRPAVGRLTSNYGYRGREFHTGVDFAAPIGTKVVAADGGTVTFAGRKGNYGYCVIISHGNGVTTLYAHNSKLLVSVGQKVGKGEQIARMGSTGRSSGSHCHFEVRINNKPVNPWKYIK